MTSHRILELNALSTAASAIAMLLTRGTLHSLFGLDTALVLDVIAVGLLAYAGALVLAARRQPVSREALIVFTVADMMWVVASAIVLVMFWGQLAPLARVLVVAAAAVVELFAALQFRAAGRMSGGAAQPV